jgi:hypothetical protein
MPMKEGVAKDERDGGFQDGSYFTRYVINNLMIYKSFKHFGNDCY